MTVLQRITRMFGNPTPPKASRPQFGYEQVLLDPNGKELVLRLQGDLDVYTGPRFKELLLRTLEGQPAWVGLDLSGVEYLDSTAIGVLIAFAKRCRDQETRYAIVVPTYKMRRIFEVTGIDRVLRVYDSLEAARKVGA